MNTPLKCDQNFLQVIFFFQKWVNFLHWEFSRRVFQFFTFLLLPVANNLRQKEHCVTWHAHILICGQMTWQLQFHEQGFLFKLCNNEILASLFQKLAHVVKFELQKQSFPQFLGPRMTRFVNRSTLNHDPARSYLLVAMSLPYQMAFWYIWTQVDFAKDMVPWENWPPSLRNQHQFK